MNENKRGMIVGLYVGGGVVFALSIARRSVSPRAAARALCMSGSPFALLTFAFKSGSYFPDTLVGSVGGETAVGTGTRFFGCPLRGVWLQ